MSEVLEAPARPALANFIGGEWRPSRSGRTYEKRGPWRPSEVVGEFPASGAEDVDDAVAAAAAAFPGWAATPAAKRGAILNKVADVIESHVEQIAQDMTLEMGKPIRESRMEATRASQVFRYYSSEGWIPSGERFEQMLTGSVAYTVHRPLGVVGLITPWNFPIAIPAWKVAPALVSGNAVVLKPATQAPAMSLELAKALNEAGLPKGVLNVVVGDGRSVGGELAKNPA